MEFLEEFIKPAFLLHRTTTTYYKLALPVLYLGIGIVTSQSRNKMQLISCVRILGSCIGGHTNKSNSSENSVTLATVYILYIVVTIILNSNGGRSTNTFFLGRTCRFCLR